MERISRAKNLMRQSRSSGTVGGEGGNLLAGETLAGGTNSDPASTTVLILDRRLAHCDPQRARRAMTIKHPDICVTLDVADLTRTWRLWGPWFRRKPTILSGPMSKFAKSRRTNRGRFTRLMPGLVLMVGGASSLASCASMAELPVSMGGMPKGTPARMQTAPAFPAVHDMPPPRRATALTESERKKAEVDLAVIRERQARHAQSLKANPD
jgi:hypothetical protein